MIIVAHLGTNLWTTCLRLWNALEEATLGSMPLAWVVLLVAFFILAKSADLFVDSSVSLAIKFKVPKFVVGIVLVALATTAPELAVSMRAAIQGIPEMALGNAVGSVICNGTLALGLAGVVATVPIIVRPAILKTAGVFLIGINLLALAFLLPDRTLDRFEGIILVVLFVAYILFLFRQYKRGVLKEEMDHEGDHKVLRIPVLITLFIVAALGILIASDLVITSATSIATSFGVPQTIIALTLIAFGTSVPEIATCVSAARKKHGDIAIGNILGAEIMNICWVAGASAIVNDLALTSRDLYFMFPWMIGIVAIMLAMLFFKFRLTRTKGIVLLSLYIVYAASFFFVYRDNSEQTPDEEAVPIGQGRPGSSQD